jgi:predicted nucleic acid-binding protein
LGARFKPVFEAPARQRVRFAVTTVAVAEVLTGPLQAGIDLGPRIAESAARLRASLRLKLPDAIQVASALAINAAALITHDRDFSTVKSLRVIS